MRLSFNVKVLVYACEITSNPQRLFVWLIEGINTAIKKEGSTQGRNSIGVLDIFGFENFNKNRFCDFIYVC